MFINGDPDSLDAYLAHLKTLPRRFTKRKPQWIMPDGHTPVERGDIGTWEAVPVPPCLERIAKEWGEASAGYGDHGSCVLGAGFRFKYRGRWYWLPPRSPWQGSCSWEVYVPQVRTLLEKEGCTDIEYEYGRMD